MTKPALSVDVPKTVGPLNFLLITLYVVCMYVYSYVIHDMVKSLWTPDAHTHMCFMKNPISDLVSLSTDLVSLSTGL